MPEGDGFVTEKCSQRPWLRLFDPIDMARVPKTLDKEFLPTYEPSAPVDSAVTMIEVCEVLRELCGAYGCLATTELGRYVMFVHLRAEGRLIESFMAFHMDGTDA